MARRLLTLACALALSPCAPGCFLSHEREAGPRRAPDAAAWGAADAGPDTTPGDAGALEPDAPDAPERACAWVARAPWRLSAPPGDNRHHDVLAVPDGFLVAYGSSNDPPPVPGRFVAAAGADGPRGAPSLVFDAPRGPFLGGVGLALGDERVLAVTWDAAGCTTRLLTTGGAPAAPVASLSRATCAAPYRMPDGAFALFDRPGDAPTSIVRLDGAASRIEEVSAPLSVLDGAFWWSRALAPDGTMLVFGMRSGVEPDAVRAQRLDARGRPLDEPVLSFPDGAASRIRSVWTRDGALVAWLEAPDGDATSQERELRVFPVDGSGRPRASARTVSTLPAYRDGGLSLARAGADVWAAYVESEPGDRYGRHTRVVALRLSWEGDLRERLVLAEGEFLRAPVVRAHERDALLAYTALDGSAHQVFVAGLVCD